MVSLRRCQSSGKRKISFQHFDFGTAIVVGSIGVFVPEVLGLRNYEINQMLSANYELSFLLLLMIVKIFVTALCIGLDFGGYSVPPYLLARPLAGCFRRLMQAVFPLTMAP